MTNRNIGGSLLPSSEPRILQPLGEFRVVALPDLDTHGLYWGKSLIAMHPNAWSCRELAECMHAGDMEKSKRQLVYILACGGLAKDPEVLLTAFKWTLSKNIPA